jgi:hypothetical protein
MVDNVGMRRVTLFGMALAMLATAQTADLWQPLRWLAGEWKGEGSGAPGRGAGAFSFRFELDGKILVRKTYTEFPAAAGRAEFRHEDLMVVYPEQGLRATYFDNEGHVIHYRATAAGDAVTFVSDASGGGPRFRLSYRRTGPETVMVRFEMASPGKPEEFKTYLEGPSRRVK